MRDLSPIFGRRIRSEFVRMLALTSTVILLWFYIYKQSPSERLWPPIMYAGGDETLVYATIKAVQDGEFGLFDSKEVHRLGAPFTANWNEFPWTEDFLYYVTGQVARVTGVPAAINLAYIAAMVLAACAFYAVGRYMRWRWEWCFAAALLYGWSFYMTRRSVAHFNLIFYWPCPFWLLLCWWTASRPAIPIGSKKFWFGCGVILFTAWNAPYYTFMFLQLLGAAAAAHLVRRYSVKTLLGPVILGGLCTVLVLSMHVDTSLYKWRHGPNPGALVRHLSELELYSLRPVDLFMPMAHRIPAVASFAWSYRNRTILSGENGTTYMGAVGCISLLWLLGTLLHRLLRKAGPRPDGLSLQALWLAAYAVCGSMNMVLGLAGFQLFRAMNRVGIVLLPLALFHLVRELSRQSRGWPRWLSISAASALLLVGLWDQTPVFSQAEKDYYSARLQGDRAFAKSLEKRLGAGAMIFQLPTIRFPEAEPILDMGGYDHLRPYIFSKTMHFSHGDDSGRATEVWRQAVAEMPVPEFVEQLEKHGFGAVIIDRDAYADRAAGLIQQFFEAGRPVEWQHKPGPFVLVPLRPAAEPQKPRLPPLFASGWYPPESAGAEPWRWSAGQSRIEFYRPGPDVARSRLAFGLDSINERTVRISHDGTLIQEVALAAESRRENIALSIDWTQSGDKYVLEFQTDQPPQKLDNGDGRMLTFRLINLIDDPPVFTE